MLVKVLKWRQDMIDHATHMAQDFWNAVTTFDWAGLGFSILQGIINGMLGAAAWLKTQLGNVGGQILQGLKDAVGVKSPSVPAAEQIGKPIAQGIALGISGNAHLARGALGNLLGGLNLPKIGIGGPGGPAANKDLLTEIRDLLKAIAADNPPLSGQTAVARIG
jgi:hypothetical protein